MKNPRCMIIKDIHGHVNFRISHIHAYLGYTIGLEILSHFVALNRNIYFCFSKISIFCLRFNNLTYRFHNCRGNTNLRGYLFQCHRLFFGNWKWVNSTTEIRVLSSSNLEGKRFGGCEDEDFWLVVWMAAGLESSAKEEQNIYIYISKSPVSLCSHCLKITQNVSFWIL